MVYFARRGRNREKILFDEVYRSYEGRAEEKVCSSRVEKPKRVENPSEKNSRVENPSEYIHSKDDTVTEG